MAEPRIGSRAARVGIPLAMLALLATLLLSVFGSDLGPPRSSGGSGYSTSALGHLAFLNLLRGAGTPVELSRASSGWKASDGGGLLLAEPLPAIQRRGIDADDRERATFRSELGWAPTILVLPKRTGLPNPANPRFLAETSLVPIGKVIEVLQVLDEQVPWEVSRARSSLPLQGWRGELDLVPKLDALQLIGPHDRLRPLLAHDGKVLVGVLDSREHGPITLLSDPDLIAHHGIGDGENLAIALAAVQRTLPLGSTLTVDEEFHGLGADTGFWYRALRFPGVLIAIQCALVTLLVVWASLGRERPRAPEPVGLEAGSIRLVESTAELLRFGRHGGAALQKYLRLSVESACADLHGPPHGTLEERLRWLDENERESARPGRVERILPIAEAVGRVPARASEDQVRELAQRLDLWRRELKNGARAHEPR